MSGSALAAGCPCAITKPAASALPLILFGNDPGWLGSRIRKNSGASQSGTLANSATESASSELGIWKPEETPRASVSKSGRDLCTRSRLRFSALSTSAFRTPRSEFNYCFMLHFGRFTSPGLNVGCVSVYSMWLTGCGTRMPGLCFTSITIESVGSGKS